MTIIERRASARAVDLARHAFGQPMFRVWRSSAVEYASRFVMACGVLLSSSAASRAEIRATINVNRGRVASEKFQFADVPAPSRSDAANRAQFTILEGRRDFNGGDASRLNDGLLPRNADNPAGNFFFAAGTPGGRLLVDLGRSTTIQRINTYSWHIGSRGPQVYRLYAPDPAATAFDAKKRRGRDLAASGWRLLADVDARAPGDEFGGQYGVTIADSEGKLLATTRYLLFDVACTEDADPFGNTFFSEIDVLDGREHPPAAAPPTEIDVLRVANRYLIEFDTTQVPEIKPWVDEKLMPVCANWYPKIVGMLPSESYAAPARFRIVFHKDMNGVANSNGLRINCGASWFLQNLDGEAAGAVVHEMVHVVQQYGRVRRAGQNPGWMVEGVADYIRWFHYEPVELRPRVDPKRAHYTDSYRTTAAFLNYVVQYHDADVVKKLNAAMRRGAYRDALWKEYTGQTVDELWAEFAASLGE
jgi:hypothetical protein